MTILPENAAAVRAARQPAAAAPPDDWRRQMQQAIRDPHELCRRLALPPSLASAAAAAQFPLFVPPAYLARMTPGDPHDPLLAQVLPRAEELASREGFSADPVGDAAAALAPGLLQKYAGRALMITTGVCAVHCRYCFRRHFPYAQGPRSLDDWAPALATLAADPAIDEVILSGGDPLTLGDGRLAELAQRLAQIPHLARLRVHTRLPILIPQRVTPALVAWLRQGRLTPIVVVHANHPREIDPAVAAALGRLVDGGVVVLNQAVLLRGVNDDAETLAALCRRLVACRVLPYYLHQLDRVAGAAHFEVPLDAGRRIVAELAARLPGYAVPRYVQEIPGAAGKVPLR